MSYGKSTSKRKCDSCGREKHKSQMIEITKGDRKHDPVNACDRKCAGEIYKKVKGSRKKQLQRELNKLNKSPYS